MNEKKTQYYTNAILKAVLNTDMITTNVLAIEVGLSEKTVRNKIESINDFLKKNKLGEIRKKRRIGIWLDATNQQKIEIHKLLQSDNQFEHFQSNQSRMYTALKYLLKINRHERLTTSQLADSMYLSVPTMLKILNDCKDWLKLFDIKLNLIRNKGFELIYNESQYRIAVKHFILRFLHKESLDIIINHFMPNVDLDSVRRCIMSTETEWGFEFAEESFSEILIFLSLSIYRQGLTGDNEIFIHENEVRMLQTYNEFSFAETIMKKTAKCFDIEIKQNEIAFLSIPILCSKMIDPSFSTTTGEIIREYDNKLKLFVSKIISVVSSVLNVDLTNDETLYNGLLIHMKPAIFRLRYEKSQSNGLKGYIKSEFKQAFRVSWLISVLFEEHFDLKVTEDELSYITLYIQSALERNKKPIMAVLVTKTSMGVNQMLCDKLKRTFPVIFDIRVVSIHDYRFENYRKADMIITTKELEHKDNKVVEIDELLSENSIHKISHKIRSLNSKTSLIKGQFDPLCHSLFEPDLIFLKCDIDNKKDLLKFLCDKLVRKGYVTKKYYQTVIDREVITPTSIGNMVAIPHGDHSQINEAKIVIAILNKPILWDVDMIDVVFLLVVKMSTEYEIKRTQLFYKQYIHLVDTDKEVNILRGFKTSTDFYRYLIS